MAYVKEITFDLLCGHPDCRYSGNMGHHRSYYNYMEIVGHSRPSKPTQDCSCYEKGEREHIVKHLCIQNFERQV